MIDFPLGKIYNTLTIPISTILSDHGFERMHFFKKETLSMKKIFCLILAAVLALGCCACSGGSDKTTITFWAAPILKEEDMQKHVDAFNESQDEIYVELEFQTWEGVSDKLQIALSTGDTPDVYFDGAARTASLPSLGVLAPVDDVMAAFDDWYESVTSFGVVDGTHYLVPGTQMGASFLSVNVTLAKELGVYDLLPEDRVSWDIHDFYAFCQAVTEAGADKGIKGTCLYAGSSTSDDILYSLMLSNGGQIIDKENNVCVANSAACVEVIEVLGNIVKNGYCLDGAAMLTGADTGTPFYNQQYVAILNNNAPAIITEFTKMVAEGYLDEVPEIRTYGVPTAQGGTMDSACWGANGIAIFDNGDDAKIAAAKTFVKYLMESVSFSEDIWTLNPNYYPSRNNGAQFTNTNETLKEEVEIRLELTAQYADFDFGILDSYWSEVRNYFYPELQAVYSGQKTAQEAMDSFAANVNEVLKNQ